MNEEMILQGEEENAAEDSFEPDFSEETENNSYSQDTENIETLEDNEDIESLEDSEGDELNEDAEVSVEGENTADKDEKTEIDYQKLINDDIEELKKEFPELNSNFEITDLKDPLRFGALRDLGLSAKEAYLATGGRRKAYDTRAHLKASVPRGAVNPMQEIPHAELKMIREVFSDMSDAELKKLYKRVNS